MQCSGIWRWAGSVLLSAGQWVSERHAWQPGLGRHCEYPAHLRRTEETNISASQQKAAGGTIPNTPLPKNLSGSTPIIFQLIASQELFEVAFFSALAHNITGNLPGFTFASATDRTAILEALTAIIAQEELHAIAANAILATAGQPTVAPCSYVFSSTTFDEAIRYASTVTDLVLGTLQDAVAGLAANGDGALLPLLTSVSEQEGEQDSYFRARLGLVPSQAPFLTRAKAQFAWSALNQLFVVNGSCPSTNPVIPLPIYGPLGVTVDDAHTTATFSLTNTAAASVTADKFSVVYINQQNAPVVVQPANVKATGSAITFTAPFPYDANSLWGLTVAAVTSKATSFADVDAATAATLFGPGLIEIK